MSVREINPEETTRASAYKLWMKAPNPMVTFFKTFDVMPPNKQEQNDRYEIQYAARSLHRQSGKLY